MPNCTSCGMSIPEGQGHLCSVCYGDPYYGRDGRLLQMMEEDRQRQEQEQWEREQEREQEP